MGWVRAEVGRRIVKGGHCVISFSTDRPPDHEMQKHRDGRPALAEFLTRGHLRVALGRADDRRHMCLCSWRKGSGRPGKEGDKRMARAVRETSVRYVSSCGAPAYLASFNIIGVAVMYLMSTLPREVCNQQGRVEAISHLCGAYGAQMSAWLRKWKRRGDESVSNPPRPAGACGLRRHCDHIRARLPSSPWPPCPSLNRMWPRAARNWRGRGRQATLQREQEGCLPSSRQPGSTARSRRSNRGHTPWI